jgi:hypothetical protein
MDLQPDPIATDRRRSRRRTKLPDDAACVLCGKQTPEALIRIDRSILELHHPLTKAAAPELTVPVCLNCHREATEGQLQAGVNMHGKGRSVPEVVVSALRSLGVFFQQLGAWLLALAEQVSLLVGALDQHHPQWRELPEAAL